MISKGKKSSIIGLNAIRIGLNGKQDTEQSISIKNMQKRGCNGYLAGKNICLNKNQRNRVQKQANAISIIKVCIKFIMCFLNDLAIQKGVIKLIGEEQNYA